jgi:hypothetical protein
LVNKMSKKLVDVAKAVAPDGPLLPFPPRAAA